MLLAAPDSLLVSATTALRVDVSWADRSTDEAGFKIQRSSSADFSTVDASFNVPADSTQFSDQSVEPSTKYYYRVVAFNDAGSEASTVSSVQTPTYGWPAGFQQIGAPATYDSPARTVSYDHRLFFTFNSKLYESDGETVRMFLPDNVDLAGQAGGYLLMVRGGQLWRTAGDASDLSPLTAVPSGTLRNFTSYNGKTYFSVQDSGSSTLWSTDGTAAGTAPASIGNDPKLAVIAGWVNGSGAFPLDVAYNGNESYYTANTPHGLQLLKIDSAGQTVQLTDFPPNPGFFNFSPHGLFAAYGYTFFFAQQVSPGFQLNGMALWRTDGTAAGTVQVKVLPTSRFDFSSLCSANGTIYFTDGGALWATDGTEAGTAVVKVIGYNNDIAVADLTSVNGRLYFTSHAITRIDDTGTYWVGQVWTSNGTVGGTLALPGQPAYAFINGTSPGHLQAIEDTVFYFANGLFRYTPVKTPLSKPAPPTGAGAIAASAGEIDLTWTDATRIEEGYTLQRSTSPIFSTIEAQFSLGANATHYVDTGLTQGTTYYYRVMAYNTGGASAPLVFPAVTTPGAPNAPTDLAAANTIPGERVNLQWVDHANGHAGFMLQRSSTPDFFPASTISLNVTLPAGTTSYNDDSVAPLATYYYRVYAYSAAGNSASATVSIQTPQSKPMSISGLQIVGVSNSEMDLQWVDRAANEDQYTIERAGIDGVFAPLAALPAHTTSYRDSGLSPGMYYTYRVRASNAVGNSAWVVSAQSRTLAPELTTPVTQLADLPDASSSTDADPTALVRFHNSGYFLATDSSGATLNTQLWRTDGTPQGTTLVKSFGIAYGGSLTVSGNLLYFTLQDRNGNVALWKTDGSDAGTVLLKSLYTVVSGQANNPYLSHAVDLDGTLYFTLVATPSTGGSIWKSDGTAAGTVSIKSYTGGAPDQLLTFNHHVYFSRFFESTQYKTDGTAAGTGPSTDYVAGFNAPDRVVAGDKVYWNAADGFHVNATTSATGEVLIGTGVGTGHLTAVGDKVVFASQRTAVGGNTRINELFVSDGTPGQITLLASLNYGGDPGIDIIQGVGNEVYFSLIGNGRELWKSDLTPAGTVQVTRLNRVDNTSSLGNLLTFRGGSPTQLWICDGTAAGTRAISNIGARSFPAHPQFMTPLNGDVYYVSSSSPMPGVSQLWKHDGATGVNILLRTGQPRELAVLNGAIYFLDGAQLWKSDGTVAGTSLVCDVQTLAGMSVRLRMATAGNGVLFFAVQDVVHTGQRYDLWRTDGTVAGTFRLGTQTIYMPILVTDEPRVFTKAGNAFYFLDGQGSGVQSGGNLWRSDGTVEGTVEIQNIFAVENMAAVGDVLYTVGILPTPPFTGWDLFRVDLGSTIAEMIHPGLDNAASPELVSELTPVGSKLFFSAPDGINGLVLWISDGTPDGTHPVVDPTSDNFSTTASGKAYAITDVNGVAYFLSADSYNGAPGPTGTVWRTDGTPEGTLRIRSISITQIALYGPRPIFLTNVGGKAVFSDGDDLWRSDGTYEGTVQIDTIGVASDGTRSEATFEGAAYAVIGSQIYFSAAIPGGGRELRVADLQPPETPGNLAAESAVGAAIPGTSGAAAADIPGLVLTWGDTSNRESGFAIERSATSDFAVIDHTFFVAANVTSFVDNTLQVGEVWYYRIRAINAGGDSAPSNSIVIGAPAVLSSSFDYSSAAHRITLHFSRDVSASLVNVHGLITDLSTGQLIPDGQISFAYDHTNNTAAITFPALSQGRLPDGRYRLTLKSDAIADSSGIKLDGDSDGAAGGDYTFDFFELRGDVDRDQTVGFSDLVAVAQNYGKSDRTLAQGDVDGDGTVGFADLVAIAQNYGKSLVSAPIAAAAAVAAVAQSAPATARPPVKPASLTARSAAMPMLVSPFSTRRIEPARKTDTLF